MCGFEPSSLVPESVLDLAISVFFYFPFRDLSDAMNVFLFVRFLEAVFLMILVRILSTTSDINLMETR